MKIFCVFTTFPREKKKSETGDGESSGGHQRSDEVQSQFRHPHSFSRGQLSHDLLGHLLFLALVKQTPRLKEKDDKMRWACFLPADLSFMKSMKNHQCV